METTAKKTKSHFILRNAGFVSLHRIIHTNENIAWIWRDDKIARYYSKKRTMTYECISAELQADSWNNSDIKENTGWRRSHETIRTNFSFPSSLLYLLIHSAGKVAFKDHSFDLNVLNVNLVTCTVYYILFLSWIWKYLILKNTYTSHTTSQHC